MNTNSTFSDLLFAYKLHVYVGLAEQNVLPILINAAFRGAARI